MKSLAIAFAVPSLLASLLVGCVTDPSQPDDQDDLVTEDGTDPHGPPPSFRPMTCQEIVDHRPSSSDGDYTLYILGQADLSWRAYCADMQGTPREYLTLTNVGAGKNTSMYAAGATSAVVTEYERVRIDPSSLTIDISDQTFATSTGSLSHNGMTVTSMPFGIAMTCGGLSTANVDLTGTPFRPEDQFPVKGANMIVKYAQTADRKSLDMSIDGSSCGFVGPALAPSEPINAAGTSLLRLAYAR